MRSGAVVIDSLFGNVMMLSQLQNSYGVKCGGKCLYVLNTHRCTYLEGGGHKSKVRPRTVHEGPEDGYRYTVLFL